MAETTSATTSESEDVLRAGYLMKSPPIKSLNETSLKPWNRRWFVLRDRSLTYFIDREGKQEKGKIDLSTVSHIKASLPSNKRKHVFSIKYGAREMFFEVLKNEDRVAWVQALTEVVKKATNGEVKVHSETDVGMPKRESLIVVEEQDAPVVTDDSSDGTVVRTGNLTKAPKLKHVDGSSMSSWQTRWFVLKSTDKLEYYKDVEGNDLKGEIDLKDCLTIRANVASQKHKFVFSLTVGEREYFLEAMSYDDRVSWVDAIKQAAMRATEDKVVYNAGGSLYTEPMEEEDGGDTPLPEDIVDVAELWPAIYNKLGEDMSEKTGQEIKEMLSTENIVLAKSAADVEDVLQGLVEDVTKVDYFRDGTNPTMEDVYKRMDVDSNNRVTVQEFLAVISPRAAREVEQARADVARSVRQSFSMKKRPDLGKPSGDLMEVGESADDVLDAMDDYDDEYNDEDEDESDDEADSGDEWDAGLIDGGVDEEADDGGDGDEGDAADEDDEDDEDDDSEALNAGPSFKKYANIPDRCYEEVLRTKYKFPTTPKITDNEELFATLVQLIKERKAYVKMGGKRETEAGETRLQLLNDLLETVMVGLGNIGDNINDVSELHSNQTLLHIACASCKVAKDIIRELLGAGANPNIGDKYGRVPIHLAAYAKNHRVVRRLLDAGANPNVVSEKGHHCLLATFKLKARQRRHKGDLKTAEVLVRSGKMNLDMSCDPHDKKQVSPPLIRLLQKGNGSRRAPRNVEPFIHLLMSHGANPNVRVADKKGKSAFWMALSQLKRGRVSYAAEAIGRVNNRVGGAITLKEEVFNELDGSKKPLPALFVCSVFKQNDALKNLMNRKAIGRDERYDVPKMRGVCLPPACTAFEAACFSGCGGAVGEFMNIDEARYKPILLNKPTGWSESWKGIENIPLLVIGVMKSNHVEAVSFAKLALKYDVDFNTPFVDGMSLFMMLVAIGHTHAAKEILNSGRKIDMAQVDKYNRNLAFYAAYGCVDTRLDVLKAVLERGADPHCADTNGVTPLLAAARNGDERSVMVLMNKAFTPKALHRPNPKYVKPKGKKMTLANAKARAAEALEARKSNLAQYTSTRCPRIPINAQLGEKQTEDNLAKIPYSAYTAGPWKGVGGDELNRKDNLGFTALWYAVLHCNADMVRMLLSDPTVDVNVVNQGGPASFDMTPIMLSACVKARGKLDIFFILLNHKSINLEAKNSQGFTLYDICYMEEVEFSLKPMTDALEKKGIKTISPKLKDALEFRGAKDIRWNNPWIKKAAGQVATGMVAKAAVGQSAAAGFAALKGVKGMLPDAAGDALGDSMLALGALAGLPVANPKWKALVKEMPYFGHTLWLRAQVMYDYTGKQELRKELIRKRKDMAKMLSLKAAIHSAKIMDMMKVGGHMATAVHKAAQLAEAMWRTARGCKVRDYDLEFYAARQEPLGAHLEQPDKFKCIQRHHIPEDYKLYRFHVGRFQLTQAPPEWKKFADDIASGTIHDERWIVKSKPKKLADWS